MPYNPQIHHRRSIRLKGYDYSQAGLYFITICCQDRAHLFGEIRRGEPTCSPDNKTDNHSPDNKTDNHSPDNKTDNHSPDNKTNNHSPDNHSPDNTPKMILNDAGMMVEKWYYELENKFNDIKCHEMVVMPNHFHCIIENVGTVVAGANLCVRPDINNETNITGETNITDDINNDNGQTRRYAPTDKQPILGDSLILGEHTGSPLHRVVQWFKTMTTNEYIRGVKQNNWQPFNGKLWQRNYYEHIVRNENDYNNIAQYIIDNPKNWDNDKLR